ncbi:unnamed protein product, partial [Prorocentrum cordatum]
MEQFSAQRDATYRRPWRKICNLPIPPTGAMMRRHCGVINHCPRVPTVGARARARDPPMEKDRIHEFSNHGQNAMAFYVQRSGCQLHLEYYRRVAKGAQEVIEKLKGSKNDGGSDQRGQEAEATATPTKSKPATRTANSRPTPRHRGSELGDQETQEDWEELDESPWSKAPQALRELLRDENANDATDQLEQNNILNKSIKLFDKVDNFRQAIDSAIPESQKSQIEDECEPQVEHLGEDTGATRNVKSREVMALTGFHWVAREKIGKEMLTCIFDVAIQQTIDGKVFYYERHDHSRDREVVNGPPRLKLGDVQASLKELAGALAWSIAKEKVTGQVRENREDEAEEEWATCAPCCAAPTMPAKGERSADPQVKQQVQNMHQNMVHCSNENLVMVLKYGKARHAYIGAAQQLECPKFAASKRPRLAKPSREPTPHQITNVMGMGIFFVLGPESTAKVPMLNVSSHGA